MSLLIYSIYSTRQLAVCRDLFLQQGCSQFLAAYLGLNMTVRLFVARAWTGVGGRACRPPPPAVLDSPERLILQHWSNGNELWSGGPPAENAVLVVEYGLEERLNVIEEEEQELAAKGLFGFSVEEYMSEVRNISWAFFGEPQPTARLKLPGLSPPRSTSRRTAGGGHRWGKKGGGGAKGPPTRCASSPAPR